MSIAVEESAAERTARVRKGYHEVGNLHGQTGNVRALTRIMQSQFDAISDHFWLEPRDGADFKALREHVERMDVLQRIIMKRLEALWQGFQAIE